jgi:hypothetical protein
MRALWEVMVSFDCLEVDLNFVQVFRSIETETRVCACDHDGLARKIDVGYGRCAERLAVKEPTNILVCRHCIRFV